MLVVQPAEETVSGAAATIKDCCSPASSSPTTHGRCMTTHRAIGRDRRICPEKPRHSGQRSEGTGCKAADAFQLKLELALSLTVERI